MRRENYDQYEPDYKRGEARWSGGFDVFAFRDELRGFCDTVRAAPCHERECGMGLLHVPEATTCFYEEFELWKGSLANMTAREFYEDLVIFRETTYPGMVLGIGGGGPERRLVRLLAAGPKAPPRRPRRRRASSRQSGAPLSPGRRRHGGGYAAVAVTQSVTPLPPPPSSCVLRKLAND